MGFIGFNQKQEATKWGFDRGWTCTTKKGGSSHILSTNQMGQMGMAHLAVRPGSGFQPQTTSRAQQMGILPPAFDLSQSNDPTTMAQLWGMGLIFSPPNGFYFWQRTALLCLFSPTPSIDVLSHWLVDFSRGITWMLHKLHDQWYASQSPQHYSHNGIVGDTFPYHIVG